MSSCGRLLRMTLSSRNTLTALAQTSKCLLSRLKISKLSWILCGKTLFRGGLSLKLPNRAGGFRGYLLRISKWENGGPHIWYCGGTCQKQRILTEKTQKSFKNWKSLELAGSTWDSNVYPKDIGRTAWFCWWRVGLCGLTTPSKSKKFKMQKMDSNMLCAWKPTGRHALNWWNSPPWFLQLEKMNGNRLPDGQSMNKIFPRKLGLMWLTFWNTGQEVWQNIPRGVRPMLRWWKGLPLACANSKQTSAYSWASKDQP